jgi:hypothetical protein
MYRSSERPGGLLSTGSVGTLTHRSLEHPRAGSIVGDRRVLNWPQTAIGLTGWLAESEGDCLQHVCADGSAGPAVQRRRDRFRMFRGTRNDCR